MKNKFILSSISINLSILSSVLLLIGLLVIKVTNKFNLIIAIIISITAIIGTVYAYFSKNKNIYNIGVFISLLLNIIFIYNIVTLNQKYNYILNLFNKEYKYTSYNIYVQKKNPIYSNINKLNNKKIGTLNRNSENVIIYLKDYINIELKTYNSVEEMISAIESGEIQSIIINEEDYQNIDSKSKDKIRNIHTAIIKEVL